MALDSKSGSRKINQHVDLAPGARNLTTTGNITAGAFYGDGSNLTGISTASANDALITITAGGGLTGGGGFTVDQAVDAIITVSHSDTSAQASVANTVFNVIQSITLDTYGHITAIESKDIGTAGFYVKTTGETGVGQKIGLGSLTYQTVQFFAGTGLSVVRTDNEIQFSAPNAANWNTAYNYSQVGHLPLAGGTLTGQLIVGSAGVAGSPALRINTPTSSTFVHAQESIAANLTTGQHVINVIGKEANTKNSGYIGYYWAGNASDSNFVTIGHWGADDLFRVYGNGNVTISGTLTATGGNSTNWNTAYSWGNHASAGYLTAEADTLSTVTARGASTGTTMTLSNAVPLNFTSTGTGTYNRGVLYHNSTDGFTYENSWSDDSVSGTRNPITLTWRGGIGYGGLRLEGKTKVLVETDVFLVNHQNTYNLGIRAWQDSTYVEKFIIGRTDGSSNRLLIGYDIAGTENAYINRDYTTARLNFNRGATTDMVLTGEGRLLVGASADLTSQRLQVNGFIDITSGTGAIRMYNGTTYAGGLGTADWAFGTTNSSTHLGLIAQNKLIMGAGAATMWMTTDYRVGIGEDSPVSKLHVKGGTLTTTSETTYPLWVSDGGDNTKALILGYDLANDVGVIQAVDQAVTWKDIAIVPTAGRVGVGAIQPSAKLHINAATGDGLKITTADVATIKMGSTTGGTTFWGFATTNLAVNDFGIYQSNSSGGDPITAGTPRLYFKGNGDVGINNTSPNYKLDVGGTGNFSGDVRSKGFIGVALGGASVSTSGWHKIGIINSRGGGIITLSVTGGNYTPVTYKINYYKNWTDVCTLKLEKYGTAGYINFARIRQDASDNLYYIEINATEVVEFQVYHDKLLGYNASGDVYTGALSAGSTSGTTNTELRFANHGTSVTRLYSNDIGIGTEVPSDKLEIYVSTYEKIRTFFESPYTSGFKFSDYNGGIKYNAGIDTLTLFANHPTVGNITFETKSAERMRIDSTGRVTVNPNINSIPGGALRVMYDMQLYNTLNFISSSGTTESAISSGGGEMNLYCAGTSNLAIKIKSNGNVGIGQGNPSTKLEINGGEAMSGGWNKNTTLAATYPVLIFNSNDSKYAGIGYDYSAAMRVWINATSNDVNGTGSQVVTIKNNGFVGINQTDPQSNLHVGGSIMIDNPSSTGGQNTNQAIYIKHPSLPAEYFTMGFKDTSRSGEQMQMPGGPYANTQAFYIECGSNEAGGICLDQDSVHVYGSSDGGSTFRVIDKDADIVTFEMEQTSWNGIFRGDVIAYGSMSSLSDQRIKTNIEPYENTLDRLCSLGVYSYNKITAPKGKKDRKEIGVIAQEVREVFPELVGSEKVSKPSSAGGLEEVLTVDYEHLTAILLQSIKELRSELKEQQKQIEELKATINGITK